MIEIPHAIPFDFSIMFQGGVYLWIRQRTNEVLYVGQTQSFFGRMGMHHVMKKPLIQPGDQVRIILVSDPVARIRLERQLIKAYSPAYNIMSNALGRSKNPKQLRTKKLSSPPHGMLTPRQFSQSLGCSLRTVHRWLNLKIVAAEKHPETKRWLIPESATKLISETTEREAA